MDTTTAIGRRRALGLALGAGATASLAAATPVAAAAPLATEGPRSTDYFAVPARVTTVSGSALDLATLDPADEPSLPWTGVPVAGFPWELRPRVGDHVTVTNGFLDLALAAVPLCSWIDATPVASGAGYAVGGRQTVARGAILGAPANALATAVQGGKGVSVCLVDTDLPAALVLQVREIGQPTATPAP